MISSILLIAVCGAWLVPFSDIVRYGYHLFKEPRPYVLALEVAVFIAVMAFGMVNLYKSSYPEVDKK